MQIININIYAQHADFGASELAYDQSFEAIDVGIHKGPY